jgi:hypothetical protein
MKNTTNIHPAQSILGIVIGFMGLYLLFQWEWVLWLAFAVGMAGVLSNYLAQKIDIVWQFIGKILGFIMPNVLLSLVFFLLLTPLALLARLFRKKDPLFLKNRQASTFRERNTIFDAKSFENPW